MNDTDHTFSILKPGHARREKSNRLARMSVHVLPLLLLLALALTFQPPACAQGTCSNGTCDSGETMQSCPQDCGIVLVDEDSEDGQAQGWYYDPTGWEIITEGANHVWHTSQ